MQLTGLGFAERERSIEHDLIVAGDDQIQPDRVPGRVVRFDQRRPAKVDAIDLHGEALGISALLGVDPSVQDLLSRLPMQWMNRGFPLRGKRSVTVRERPKSNESS